MNVSKGAVALLIAAGFLCPVALLAGQDPRPPSGLHPPSPPAARARARSSDAADRARARQSAAQRVEVYLGALNARRLNALGMLSVPGHQVLEARVNLDLDNLSVREALTQLAGQAKQEIVIDADVPGDVRVTVRAQNVRLGTALDLLTETTGASWNIERRQGKTIVHVTKPTQPVAAHVAPTFAGIAGLLGRVEGQRMEFEWGPDLNVIYRLSAQEERSTFTCPHCKGQVTVIRQRQQPKCTRCSRPFQAEWQFCPIDGARRPPAPGEWQFCPVCGKPVASERRGEVTTTPRVEDEGPPGTHSDPEPPSN